WLSTPDATWMFWPCNEATTSLAVMLSDCRRSGSSQTRIEKSRPPNTVIEPTPSTRVNASLISSVEELERNNESPDLSGEWMFTTIRMSGEAFATVMPMLRTSTGTRGWATATRFWTCTWAISRLVPSSNETAMLKRPSEVAFEDM